MARSAASRAQRVMFSPSGPIDQTAFSWTATGSCGGRRHGARAAHSRVGGRADRPAHAEQRGRRRCRRDRSQACAPRAMTARAARLSRSRARDGARRPDRRRAVRQRLEGDQRRGGAAIDRELRRGVVAIVGGQFKGGDLRDLREAAGGATAARWSRSARRRRWCARRWTMSCRSSTRASMREAVAQATRRRGRTAWCCWRRRARASTGSRDYAERGRVFKEEVARLASESSVTRSVADRLKR